ncbi:TIGR03747 family integrating conjugative element membrane protein [Aquisalimonas asiatica]|uniref:Integrating conjugative element membrane protein, PFL_4697 family n=1 Tax=Aquisalimonas asiatica TaxID=406100 RepID=A0A1H8VR07_9GAMM|nr:TIGR03747 family integrating conjugative element membrane protein [Aquisalimonas asiatica]SEP17866.1 integrating conjugative element membrane protein, PFL_4697 family [Aquisalimonas asiatica]
MATRDVQASRHPAARKPGWVGSALGMVGQLVLWLLVALLFSILAEWVGQTWVWPERGVEHSRMMLEREAAYINQDFHRSAIPGVGEPAAYVQQFADVAYEGLIKATGVEWLLDWLARPPDPEGGRFQRALRSGYAAAEPYVLSAITITQVFALRLGVLTLAMPVFVLFALVAVVDGLVQRELRRWGGGRESSFVYHHAKRLMAPSIAMAWVVYLAMPVPVHPNWVILPFAVLNAVTVAITASRFKKYL